MGGLLGALVLIEFTSCRLEGPTIVFLHTESVNRWRNSAVLKAVVILSPTTSTEFPKQFFKSLFVSH